MLLATQDLIDKLNDGRVSAGATLVINSRQPFAFDALPPLDGLAHYRFLDKRPVPNVVVERDIGAPSPCIRQVADLLRVEMTNPEVRRRYRLRRCTMKLLAGVSGSGKTLTVEAIHRQMYEIMSEVTGVPMDQLPPRVFRLCMSKVLSMWLGESDKNLERFFDEVEQLAREPFLAPDGRKIILPVLTVLEEIDGLARARGHEPIYDRILTTALQRLDPNRESLNDLLIVFLGTTNEPQQVDTAFMRRIGGTVEQFGRLRRKAFMAVLQKHLQERPVAANNGTPPDDLRRKMASDLTAWLFSPNGADHGVVELTYAGATTPVIKYRRDLLTGAMVERAVHEASEAAAQAEHGGAKDPGLTLDLLVREFEKQITGIVDQLREQNAAHYLDLPDGVRVATLRRIPQPSRQPIEYQRT